MTNMISVDYDWQCYESSLTRSHRNKEGIFYTPVDIINDFFNLPGVELENKTFCDPCCGSGNFLVRALDLGFKPENIYGFDVDRQAVEISKSRIYQKSGYVSENIRCEDFLSFSISGLEESYDFIYTNPPWGKKLSVSEKKSLGKILGAGLSVDSCSLFYFCCMIRLKLNGKIGLILPEAFFNIATYKDARKSILKYKIEKLIHYGHPFKEIMSGAVGLIIEKTYDDNSDVSCVYNGVQFMRSVSSFINNPKLIFNIASSSEDQEIISYVYSKPHITLLGGAKWGMGIVTGDNGKYLTNKRSKGKVPIFKGSDITKTGLKPASKYISKDLSKFQQVAPLSMYEAKEKLIYRFISSNLCFFHDTQGRFVLNSANMLIVDNTFPVPMKVLCDLMNSDFMNWLFRKIFNSHKILRGDLESLPIHTQYLPNECFNESDYLNSLGIERDENGTYRFKK